ncbi:MAG: thiolase family protein [Deltaproteobacteria bacterium]|nr:thiolase family protein [Deltaproteobacteria bacterium]
MKVYCLDIRRTPFCKIFTELSCFSPLDMGVELTNKFVQQLHYNIQIDQLIASSVMLDPAIPNLAREIVIRSKLPKTIPAHFVTNYCISSLLSTGLATSLIKSGQAKSVLCLGVEMMSKPKFFLSDRFSDKLVKLNREKNILTKLKIALGIKFKDLKPLTPSPKEPSTNLSMGESCELMNREYGVSRLEQDQYALRSHKKAVEAIDNGYIQSQIIEVNGVFRDNIPRRDSSVEKLSKLPPVFAQNGTLTAGNSSALTDGASVGLFVSEDICKNFGVDPLFEVVDFVFTAVAINDGLLMAPVLAVSQILERNKLHPSEIDIFEIHEAFACQILINLKVLEQGWPKYAVKPTKIELTKVNIWGGSLAFGHPFAATGLRLLANAGWILKKTSQKLALVASCAAGGGGAAFLIKNPNLTSL